MEKKTYHIENAKQKERVVLLIYSIYTIGMTVVSFLLGWSRLVPQIVITGMLVSWFIHIKQYKGYRFRAFFTSCMAWMNFTIYGIFSEDLFGILSTMCAMIILLGIYCIYETVYIAVAISLFLLLYHGFYLSDISISLSKDGTRLILQILSVFVAEYITYYLVKQQEESNKKLLDTIEDLKRAERSKNDFMANVSHEIRTPINTICGISEMVMRDELDDTIRRDIFDIQAAGRNLLSVVTDILDFSELESGKMELVEEPYNITSTVNDIMNMAIAKNSEKNLEMIVDCDASIPNSLLGDEQKIRRIIMNIVDNAIKFTKEGGIVIVVSSRKEEYGINLSVTVKDTGIGMNAENIENLFTSFNQVDTKRNRQEGGIGLGLAIVQAIVAKMGGFITVRSAPDKGSEIQFVIPQKVLDKAPIVSVKNPETIRVAGYIDMEKYNYSLLRDGYAASIQHMVEQLGFYYRHCKNLMELKRRVEKEKFTHVFVSFDEYLEDKAYFEELSEHVKVIVVQGRDNEEDLGGRILHVYKPFYVLSVASVLNGEHIIQSMDGSHYQNRRFIAPKANVLVVDDNIMNLRVVEGLLRPYQIKVFVAGSGKEALTKIEGMEFDFVFMDHMMPEMDGVETLHRIRQKPGQYFKNVPVIALTANAIGGAREMFLSEGFSDFVAKPIETSVLERVLRRHIPEHKIIKIEEAPEQAAEYTQGIDKAYSPPSREEDKTIRMEGIDVSMGLGFSGGDMKDYIEIVQVYYTSGLIKFKEIQKAYDKRDWKNYSIQVHSLKSMSMGIGAAGLSDMAKELEAAGKAEREDYIFKHNEEMLEEYEKILGVIGRNRIIFPEGTPDEEKAEQLLTGQKQALEEGADSFMPGTASTSEPAAMSGPSSMAEPLKMAGSLKTTEPLKMASGLPEISKEQFLQETEKLQEQLETFELEGIEAVLGELLQYQYEGTALKELLGNVKAKADAFDFMGAGEELETVKAKLI